MPTGGSEHEVVDGSVGSPPAAVSAPPPDPIASPHPGRARAIASAVIALWVLCQVALPVSYYLGDSLAEERFAWRMFSSVSVFGGQCVLSVVETIASPAGGERTARELNLDLVVHPAWGIHLRRGRRIAIDRFLAWRCQQDPSIVQIELRRSCDRGPEAGTRLELVRPCASGPLPAGPDASLPASGAAVPAPDPASPAPDPAPPEPGAAPPAPATAPDAGPGRGSVDRRRGPVTAWDCYWFGPVAAIRPYILMRAVYAVLALDLWTVTMPRGGRYGFGGFDVAHFGWLDAVRPFPSPALYVGLLLLIGLLAFVCALCDPARWMRALIAVLHTYSWTMSLHDTFQHHYFLSMVLTAFVFFPRGAARDLVVARAAARPALSAWAFVLLAVNVSVVYFFAGVSKLDVAWRTGEILQLAPLSLLGPIQTWAESAGVPRDLFWAASALGVVVVEWTVAVGYLIGVRRDTSRSRWVAALAGLTCVLAIGFHASAEVVLSLRIGWFTYYMIIIAAVYLLPARWLHAAAGPLLRRAAWLDTRLAGGTPASARGLAGAAVAAAGLASVGSALALDLPGAPWAGVAGAVAIALAAVGGRALSRRPPAPVVCGVAGALAAVAMGAAVATSDAQFEYYMAVGRQLERFGQRAAATGAYERARRYGTTSPDGLWRSGAASSASGSGTGRPRACSPR